MRRGDTGAEGNTYDLDRAVDVAIEAIEALAVGIGPRPPTSEQERAAADWFAGRLGELGLKPKVTDFPAYRSFGQVYLPLFLFSLGSGLIKKRSPRLLLASVAAAIGYWEGDFRSWGGLEKALPQRSRNVIAEIVPKGVIERTVCLVSHLDSSRSGMMFHPAITPYVGRILAGVSAAIGVQVVAALVRYLPGDNGRLLSRVASGVIAVAAGLVAERELRGEDVAGANDNASGVGACLALADRLAQKPLGGTRVVILATGGEEAGVLGMRRFLETTDTEGWLFLNFDGVGADAPLRYLRVEGGPLNPRAADPGLIAVAERVGADLPELGLSGCDHGSGLPYDATAVLARGGRALTIACQGRSIPNYHWPTDLPEAIEPAALARSIRLAQEMLARIDRGEADRVG